MKFHLAETNENFPLLRYVSEGGQWQIGLVPMLFGVRVRAGRTDDRYTVALDYCAGADLQFQRELLATVIVILSEIPEEATHRDIHRFFPESTVKPIDRDPICWPVLKRMRHVILKANAKEA